MLKILFFIETLGGGGAEKVLCDLVNHMNQQEFDITVQTLWPAENKNLLADGIRYRSVYPKYDRWNSYRMRLESALGLTYRLHMKDDYDIEVAYLECGTTKILSASTNRHAVKVAWVHCDLAIKMAGVLDSFVEKATPQYRRFDQIACVSQDVLHSFQELFGSTPPSSIVYNTVDDTQIREKAAQQLPADAIKRKLTVVTLGRLTYQKAYDRLLRVHKQLQEEGLDFDLWILGEGEDRAELEQLIQQNHMEESVRLFGFQKNPYPFMKAADLLVCSSRYEGFSTFVTEGLILGKPIVTTDCTGMRELLGDSEYGLITDNSEKGLHDGLVQLLTQPEALRRFSEASKLRGSDFSSASLTREAESFLKLTYQKANDKKDS